MLTLRQAAACLPDDIRQAGQFDSLSDDNVLIVSNLHSNQKHGDNPEGDCFKFCVNAKN